MATVATQNPSIYPAKAGAPGTSSFWWSKLGSLLALLPLGVWTVNHLWDNLAVWAGATAWEASVTTYSNPISHGITLVIVFLPLVLHMLWGLQRLFSFRPNNGRYNNFGNLKYILQRASAVGILFFLGAHVYLAMLKPRLGEGHPEAFGHIAGAMAHHPPTLLVYLLGTLAVSYHLGNGIWSFAMGWGIVGTRPALKRFDYIGIGIFLLLLVASWAVIYGMYQAGQSYPLPADL
ncbi:MAG: succinate dehydrogenase [Myxococcaceae bacterium]